MRIAAIVESRMTSRRLPGKNLRPILGRPMVARLMERLRRVALIDVVCLATSTDESDAPLVAVARQEGAACHRGSLDDVLGRVLAAAQSVGADAIVEITGDCPLADPGIIDAAIRRYQSGDVDYVINVLDRRTFPDGFDVQVYGVPLLAEVARLTADPTDRVDVTPYIYHHADRYRVLNLLAPPELDRPQYRLSVDYLEDFEVVTAIYEALYPRDPAFTAFDIMALLDAHPGIARRNAWRAEALGFPTSVGPVRHEVMALHAR
jgi:spore coat polysaccharide biosynthesis protein SpsF